MYSSFHLLEHLRYDIVLFHFARARSLRANDFALDQVGVEAVDHWVLAPLPLLFRASRAEAESALETVFAAKLSYLHIQLGTLRVGFISERDPIYSRRETVSVFENFL